jgi:hypothetical protein
MGVVDDRARKIGENESLFRAVNERIEGLGEAFGLITESMTVVCECGDDTCIEQIELQVPEYERVRSDPTTFVIVPGHEIPDVEDVVEHHDAYDVVRKHRGAEAEIARELDPRS